ncbi:MAG: hypothetical protein Q9191_006683, partial [Dirinaria sp. TL-2023a]
MDTYKDEAHVHLLSSSEESLAGHEHVYEKPRPRRITRSIINRCFSILSALLLAISLFANGYLLRDNHVLKKLPDLGRSKFSKFSPPFIDIWLDFFFFSKDADYERSGGLGYDHPVAYYMHTDYIDINTTESNMLWESIDTSPVVVALSD